MYIIKFISRAIVHAIGMQTKQTGEEEEEENPRETDSRLVSVHEVKTKNEVQNRILCIICCEFEEIRSKG